MILKPIPRRWDEKTMEESWQEKKVIRFILFTLVMTKEEVNKLHEELNELSALEEQNLERMVEIAKVLNAYYMWWKRWENAEDAEEK